MVTITNQNVIVLGGFTVQAVQAVGTNNVRCNRICVILHNLFHMGNFSSVQLLVGEGRGLTRARLAHSSAESRTK